MSNNSSNPLYYIYLNLHSSNPKTFSLMQNGLVTKYLASFKIERARFLVRKGGHATAVKEQTRNVHAFVVCEPKHVNTNCEANIQFLKDVDKHFFPIHYHYNDGDFFSIKFGDETIPLDEDYEFRHVLLHDHKCYLLKHIAYEYLLKRKVTAKHFLDLDSKYPRWCYKLSDKQALFIKLSLNPNQLAEFLLQHKEAK